MTQPRSGGRRGRRPALADGDDRLAELEARLERLEGEPGLRERGRSMMQRVLPPDAARHFRNAGREQLLGVRSIVDFWIRRIDALEERASVRPIETETIDID